MTTCHKRVQAVISTGFGKRARHHPVVQMIISRNWSVLFHTVLLYGVWGFMGVLLYGVLASDYGIIAFEGEHCWGGILVTGEG